MTLDHRWRNFGQSYGPDPEERERAARMKTALSGRLVGGLNMVQEAAVEYALDPRYRFFADLVAPQQWHAAAQKTSHDLARVIQSIIESGPDGVLPRARPDLTVALWQTAVMAAYRAALTAPTEDTDEPVTTIEDDVIVTTRGELDPWLQALPTEELADAGIRTEKTSVTRRPASLAGTRPTEGRPSRPGKSNAARRRQRGAQKARLGRGSV